MKTVKLYWVTALLILATLFLAIKGVSVKKEAAQMTSQITLRQEPASTKTSSFSVTPSDMMRAKENIEAYALSNNLKLQVKVSGSDITITSAPAPRTEADSTSSDSGEAGNEDKAATLANFADEETGKGLLNFLNMISDMKYHLSYKTMCIGVECGAGIEMVLSCDGKVKPEQPSAPAPPAGKAG